jgi:prephenate dehydrogenase
MARPHPSSLCFVGAGPDPFPHSTVQRFNGSDAISIFHPPAPFHYLCPVHFLKITIVGVGLLGGSLGLAARKHRLAGEIAGFVRRAAAIGECEKRAATDYATTDLLAAVCGADLIVLCTPLAQMRVLVAQMIPALKRGAIVTDVGSVKSSVVRAIESLIHRAGAHYVGSHPMAGAEKAGVSAARADLFADAVCVVTPTSKTNRSALAKVERFWKAVGSRVLRLTPEIHDALVSRSSHLPHIAAATLTNLVLDPAQSSEQAMVCANGFRDTTRIASGSPEMWRDIALANRRHLVRALDRFIGDLRRFQQLLKEPDAGAIARFFEHAKHRILAGRMKSRMKTDKDVGPLNRCTVEPVSRRCSLTIQRFNDSTVQRFNGHHAPPRPH